MLFGDSITQGSFEPGYVGFGQRLARMQTPFFALNILESSDCHEQMYMLEDSMSSTGVSLAITQNGA